MKILVYGAGVLGCNLARNLFRAGKDVTLLARGNWAEEIKQNGLRIKDKFSPRTSVSRIPVVTALAPDAAYDVIFVVLRYTQLDSVLDTLRTNRTKNIVFILKTKDGRDIARPIKGRLNPGRLATLRTCYSLLCLRSAGMAFYMKSPCADSRHNRFGISQCYYEAVAHRHGHSQRTVFVLDLNDPCLSIRHTDEMSLTISVRYHRGPPFLL